MRAVVLAVVVDDDDGFGEAAELLDVEQLVAYAAVAGLDVVAETVATLSPSRVKQLDALATPSLGGVRRGR